MASTVRERMNGVLEFLEESILPGVSRDNRSELRAAMKLLATLRDELDILPSLLSHESTALADLAEATLPHVEPSRRADLSRRLQELRPNSAAGAATLTQQETSRAQLRGLVADIAISVSRHRDRAEVDESAEAALIAIYRQLGADAATRTPFQSVFPSPLYAAVAASEGNPS